MGKLIHGGTIFASVNKGIIPTELTLSETASGQTYTFTDDFNGYVLIIGRDAVTFDYDAPIVQVQSYTTLFGNAIVYSQSGANVTIQKTFIKCVARTGDYITINDYYSNGEFYLFSRIGE